MAKIETAYDRKREREGGVRKVENMKRDL
jgi:hypothetical protein